MKKLLIYLSILCLLVHISSCEKDSGPEPYSLVTELLTQKVWTFDVAVGNADQAVVIDLLNEEWAGLTIDFKTDGTYTVVSNNGTDTGVWEIDSTEDNILLDKGTNDELNFFIHSISETEMRLQMEIGTSGIFSVYFK